MGRKRNNRRATPHRNVAPNAPAGAPSQWGGTWRQQNPSPSHATTRSRYQVLAICVFLLLAVGLVFGQTVRYEFVNYDDDVYVYENPQVAQRADGLGQSPGFLPTIIARTGIRSPVSRIWWTAKSMDSMPAGTT